MPPFCHLIYGCGVVLLFSGKSLQINVGVLASLWRYCQHEDKHFKIKKKPIER